MAENERGFHNPRSQGHDHNKGGATGGEGRGTGGKGAGEPTNHGGHTYDMSKTHAHHARVEAMRGHAGAGQQDHERIAHDTHKLHQNPGQHISHGDKRGESANRGG